MKCTNCNIETESSVCPGCNTSMKASDQTQDFIDKKAEIIYKIKSFFDIPTIICIVLSMLILPFSTFEDGSKPTLIYSIVLSFPTGIIMGKSILLFMKFRAKKSQNKSNFKERKAKLDQEGAVYCPRCLSTHYSANKKGYGVGKAAVGAALTGGIGLVAGGIGSQKVKITCLKCGTRWTAGK